MKDILFGTPFTDLFVYPFTVWNVSIFSHNICIGILTKHLTYQCSDMWQHEINLIWSELHSCKYQTDTFVLVCVLINPMTVC